MYSKSILSLPEYNQMDSEFAPFNSDFRRTVNNTYYALIAALKGCFTLYNAVLLGMLIVLAELLFILGLLVAIVL